MRLPHRSVRTVFAPEAKPDQKLSRAARASHFCLGKSNQNRPRRVLVGAVKPPRFPARRSAWRHGAQTRFARTWAPLRPPRAAVLGALYGAMKVNVKVTGNGEDQARA
jgi:hypothetical protein